MAGKTEHTPITDAELAELDRLHSRRRECNKDAVKWQQSIGFCYRHLRARLEAAEREQQRVHELANRLLDANNGLIDTIRKLDPEALCDWHDSIGGDEYLQRWLAARDAQQRRDGAAEVWDQISKITAHVTDGFIRVSKGYAEEQAESLREGGE
jgi:hypothetical protein